MPVRDRQAIASGLLGQESGWDELDPPSIGGTHLAAGTYTIWAVPPTNEQAKTGNALDSYFGTALAAANGSIAQGVLNYPVAQMASFYIYMSATTGTTGTFALAVASADAGGHTASTTLVSTTANSTLAAGWNLIAMTVPAERQWTNKIGSAQGNKVCLLFPGDVVQLTIGTAAPPATTVFMCDIV